MVGLEGKKLRKPSQSPATGAIAPGDTSLPWGSSESVSTLRVSVCSRSCLDPELDQILSGVRVRKPKQRTPCRVQHPAELTPRQVIDSALSARALSSRLTTDLVLISSLLGAKPLSPRRPPVGRGASGI